MIQFVLLDLDDTILDFHRAEAAAIRKTLSDLGVFADDAVISRYLDCKSEVQVFRKKSGEDLRFTFAMDGIV